MYVMVNGVSMCWKLFVFMCSSVGLSWVRFVLGWLVWMLNWFVRYFV